MHILLDVVLHVEGGVGDGRHGRGVVGDSDFASEHLGDQRLVVFLREAVGPLRGLHRVLDVVGFGHHRWRGTGPSWRR